MKQSRYTFLLLMGLIVVIASTFHTGTAQDSPTATPGSSTTNDADSRVVRQDMVEAIVEIGTVNSDRVNVRDQPSRNGDILAQFNQGVPLKVLDKQNDWVQVKLLSGTGWVSRSLLSIREETRMVFPEPAVEVQQAIEMARDFKGGNLAWKPFEWIVGDVSMMLVPPRCFTMGEFPDLFTMCFDEPFWIDKYEVSNGQFASFGGVAGRASSWSAANLPRERINWFEARFFCELRDSRLPTEAEWEFAARGPNSWTFPWGTGFLPGYVVYRENSNNQTAEVGGRPAGQSWVGAQDLSGNVWEWTSSFWAGPRDPDAEWAWSGTGTGDYPYDATDGRESDTGSRVDVTRVMRGGALNQNEYQLRSMYRYRLNPDDANYVTGFRCVRSISDTP